MSSLLSNKGINNINSYLNNGNGNHSTYFRYGNQQLSQIQQQQFLGFVKMYLFFLGQIFSIKVSGLLLQKTFQYPPLQAAIWSAIVSALFFTHLQVSSVSTEKMMLKMADQIGRVIPLPFWPTLERQTLSEMQGSKRNIQLFLGNSLSTPGARPAQTFVQVVIVQSLETQLVCWITENPQDLVPQVSFIQFEMQLRRCYVSSSKKQLAVLMKLRKEQT